MLAEYLIQKGADINYHKPDMVFPYASTPVTEAARHNDFFYGALAGGAGGRHHHPG